MANALSCRDSDDVVLVAMYAPSFELYDDLRREMAASVDLCALWDAIDTSDRGEPWRVMDGLILWDSRVFLPTTSMLLLDVLCLAHTAGHEGV